MGSPRRSEASNAAGDDAGRIWGPAWGFLVLAAAIVAAGATYFLMSPAVPVPVERVAQAVAPVSGASHPAALSMGKVTPAVAVTPRNSPPPPQVDGVDPTPDLSSYVNRGENPSMKEVIERLNRAGIETGLAAFSPPGTRPPMVGLAVPEDFELPPGFVRHHQATDDGQRIEAILMFAPDHQVRNAANQPIPMPKDRLVPPELVPPGFPIRRIVIPAPKEPGGPGL